MLRHTIDAAKPEDAARANSPTQQHYAFRQAEATRSARAASAMTGGRFVRRHENGSRWNHPAASVCDSGRRWSGGVTSDYSERPLARSINQAAFRLVSMVCQIGSNSSLTRTYDGRR